MRFLITGASGNLARSLASRLQADGHQPILFDQAAPSASLPPGALYIRGDIVDGAGLRRLFQEHRPTHVLHFASLLSRSSEESRARAWSVNAEGSFRLFECAMEFETEGFFFPSTGATYGTGVPDPLPEDYPQWPENLYGVTKVLVERLGHYYRIRHGLDFRCLRLPLVLSRFAPPGAATAYASHAFVAAAAGRPFAFPVPPTAALSTVYVKDVVAGIHRFVMAPRTGLRQSVYNVHGFSPTAGQIGEAIKRRISSFTWKFEPDPQVTALVDGWADVHEDASARRDWGWSPGFDLEAAADDMLADLAAHPPAPTA